MTDWRLPEHRREAFQRFYAFHLKYRTHPGCVYFALPALADAYDLDEEGRAWLVWLNGNTQNPVTTQLLLDAAPTPAEWPLAVEFWNEHFRRLEWDTDRRHQKSKFGEATEQWAELLLVGSAAEGWLSAAEQGWQETWAYSLVQPYMGRLSAWSMLEYARILLPGIPDAATLLLQDKSGSRSHRNGLAFIAGYDSVYWDADTADVLGLVPELEQLGADLLEEARNRTGHPDVSYLTLESALCTYKSWHKPSRRYPNVYADMMYNRLVKAEERWGDRFGVLWSARAKALPPHLLLEQNPNDPGMVAAKQNHYLVTGEPIMMEQDYPDMQSGFAAGVAAGSYGQRERAVLAHPAAFRQESARATAPPPAAASTEDPAALTPVEQRNGLWYKREDLFRWDNGVNGSKLRACHHLVSRAVLEGAETVVSAASVLSPQSAMSATVAARLGLSSVTIVGGTTPEKAVRHKSIAMAAEEGSVVEAIAVGYNPALQSAGKKTASSRSGHWQMPYGITTPPDASWEEVRAFVEVGAAQVANLPDVTTLVLPFGSGNTATGVLYGLARVRRPEALERVVLMTIGPDRYDWMLERLADLGVTEDDLPPLERIHLHPTFATYGDRMPETLDGIVLHPTYEGKVARYLNQEQPDWWTARDGRTCFWIVGGPLP